MKETHYFGVWIGVMVWKIDLLDFDIYEYPNFKKEDEIKYYENMVKLKLDDYVLNDFHVNKNFGLTDFALNGAFVKDEYMELLGENSEKYKEYYIEVKKNTDKNKVNKKKNKVNIHILEFIDWKDIEVVKIIEEGVCGGKLPCIIVNYSGDKKILKEMGKGMNYGKDYIIVDECKKLVGLKDMNMKRIKSNKGLVKKDKKKKKLCK